MLFGSRYDSTAWYRNQFTLIPTGEGQTRLMFMQFIVGNRGSAFERREESRGKYSEWQRSLDKLKISIESE